MASSAPAILPVGRNPNGVAIDLISTRRFSSVSVLSASCSASRSGEAAKGAIVQLTKSMAIELAPHGITCNAVLPGTVETDINREALSDPEVREYWLKRGPIGGLGQPEDIAAMTCFLLSDAAGFMTGQTVVASGGLVTLP